MAAEPPYRFAARGTSVGLLRWMAARSIWSMPPEHARRVLAGGGSPHSRRGLAARGGAAPPLPYRELHGGTGGCGEAGSRRIATGSARQVAPLILSSSFPPKRAAGDCLCRKVSAAAWPCSSSLQPTWRKLPKSRCRGTLNGPTYIFD